jgi:hypothetical protein
VSQINRVERLVINLDTTMPITCNWDTCDRRARTTYQVRLHEHPLHWRCDYGRHTIMAFCSDSHLDYWVASSGRRAHDLAERNRGLIYGQHSAGNKRINR